VYHVTKHYPHTLGLSACFRQHRATSHCNQLHGYALAFTFEFEAISLNAQNWVIDFGSMRPIKSWLEDTFDHRLLFAADDPERDLIYDLARRKVANILELENVGCEAFAKLAFQFATGWLGSVGQINLVRLTKVTVAEHGGNSASYSEPT
jgi:6-pyruvoyltetrahydropterin/6-carboxytetrahydropterin synthase